MDLPDCTVPASGSAAADERPVGTTAAALLRALRFQSCKTKPSQCCLGTTAADKIAFFYVTVFYLFEQGSSLGQ
jgi:hypothetical protein